MSLTETAAIRGFTLWVDAGRTIWVQTSQDYRNGYSKRLKLILENAHGDSNHPDALATCPNIGMIPTQLKMKRPPFQRIRDGIKRVIHEY